MSTPTPSPSSPLDPCPCCKAAAEETHGAKGTEFESLVKICCAATNTDNSDEYPNGCPLECATVWCATVEEAEAIWRERDIYFPTPQQGADPGQPAAWLTWTMKKPIVEGWYFVRMPAKAMPDGKPGARIVEFLMRDHEAGVTKWFQESAQDWEPIYEGREWAGPLPEPGAALSARGDQ